MIIDLLLDFVSWILSIVFGFLPQVTTPPGWFLENVTPSLGLFSALGGLPFIGTVLQIALLILGFMATWQGIVFINWLYNKIRGSG